jgi:hypothetical protein
MGEARGKAMGAAKGGGVGDVEEAGVWGDGWIVAAVSDCVLNGEREKRLSRM